MCIIYTHLVDRQNLSFIIITINSPGTVGHYGLPPVDSEDLVLLEF